MSKSKFRQSVLKIEKIVISGTTNVQKCLYLRSNLPLLIINKNELANITLVVLGEE